MLFIFFSRGWTSDANSNNKEYYLYINLLYRTISNDSLWEDGKATTIHIGPYGDIGQYGVADDSSGVLYSTIFTFRIMLKYISNA